MKQITQWRNANLHYLFILYFVANFFLLINYSGVYWDDWTIVNQKPETILKAYTQTGFWWMGYLHVFLQKIGNGIYVYRLICFFSYFISGVFIYYILERLQLFSKSTIFFLSLFFLIAPVNDARVALINTPAILTLCIFYFAFFLLSIYLDNSQKLYLRLFILYLFFISFCLESLLVFYAIPLCYIIIKTYQRHLDETLLSLIKIFFKRYWDFIALPLLFFGLKHTFIQPYGLYQGYNHFDFNFFNLLNLLAKSFTTSFFAPLFQALTNFGKFCFFTPLILLFVMYIVKKVFQDCSEKSISNTTNKAIVAGILFFLTAVFPYCAVGKLPHLDYWGSRNQILVPLSMAFIVYYCVLKSAAIHRKAPLVVLNVLISAFITQTLYSHYLYNQDWLYQQSLLAQFKQSPLFQKNTTFIAKDNLEMDIWIHKRGLDFYEVNGLLKRGFHEDTRLYAHNIIAIKNFSQYKMHPQYNFSHWVESTPVYLELSKNADFSLTFSKQFWLFYNGIFNRKVFENEISKLTIIKEVQNS